MLAADSGNFADGIDGTGRCSPHGCADEAGTEAGLEVSLDLACQRFGPHGEVLVHFDLAQVVRAQACYLYCFFNRRVRLC